MTGSSAAYKCAPSVPSNAGRRSGGLSKSTVASAVLSSLIRKRKHQRSRNHPPSRHCTDGWM
ncbi:AAEL006325-PA [Aedes aegypti]|uniref:AAEL006325-PA n=1 Tax=Aedes aegypti TaxID=7159 RepID=Q176M8_AEDAE|nr:AAEL006325-PA [Aedes aegypti]